MHFGTKVLHTGVEVDPVTGAASVPIYQASTFRQVSVDQSGKYDYARSGNPTRAALEEAMAALEMGTRGYAFASGMAAISSVFCLFSSGDHLVVGQDVYGGTYRVLTRLFPRFGLQTTFVDAGNLEEVEAAIKPNTRALFLETPSNPLMKITDLANAASLAKRHGLLTLVDNTFMTPYLQRPLELGADIVVHSATKYLAGHSDVIGGVVVVKEEQLAREVYFIQNSFGAILGPQDAWLVMRGLKTLKVRMDQHQLGAAYLARWLREQPLVAEVFYPGLADHPGHETAQKQSSGAGGIVSFTTVNEAVAKCVMEAVQIPVLAVSLGAVESIISYPAKMSHAAIPAARRKELGINDNLIRFSVGLEDPEDLAADLAQAFDKANSLHL
ncbi:MAG: trans-sulfuration enzyme family protein [Bacillota bacterium]